MRKLVFFVGIATGFILFFLLRNPSIPENGETSSSFRKGHSPTSDRRKEGQVEDNHDGEKTAAGEKPSFWNDPEFQYARKNGALAGVTVLATEPNGHAVADADVSVAFFSIDKKPIRTSGKTDSTGKFFASAKATWNVRCIIRKAGYYDGLFTYYLQHDTSRKPVVDGRWQPWNPVVHVILTPIGGTVSFHRKPSFLLTLPDVGSPIGFDFDTGDMVAPFGSGKTPHVFFRFGHGNEHSAEAESLELSFPGEGTGVIPGTRNRNSAFHFPLKAPDAGYVQRTNLVPSVTMPRTAKGCRDAANRFFTFKTWEEIEGVSSGRCRFGFMDVVSFSAESREIRFWYGISEEPDNPVLEGYKW